MNKLKNSSNLNTELHRNRFGRFHENIEKISKLETHPRFNIFAIFTAVRMNWAFEKRSANRNRFGYLHEIVNNV